jgi:hypothetical protein
VELIQIDCSPWKKSVFKSYNHSNQKSPQKSAKTVKFYLKIAAVAVVTILIGLTARIAWEIYKEAQLADQIQVAGKTVEQAQKIYSKDSTNLAKERSELERFKSELELEKLEDTEVIKKREEAVNSREEVIRNFQRKDSISSVKLSEAKQELQRLINLKNESNNNR